MNNTIQYKTPIYKNLLKKLVIGFNYLKQLALELFIMVEAKKKILFRKHFLMLRNYPVITDKEKEIIIVG